MRTSLMLEGQEGVTWPHWLAVADACERLGFEGLFTSDHYLSVVGARGRGSNDAWTILAALAARTERIRLGTLVSPVTFRHPSVLAKLATTVDHDLGRPRRPRPRCGLVGGGASHATASRSRRSASGSNVLEEQLEIVHGLLTEDAFLVRGPHYQLDECAFLFKPVQRPHPPIILGGNGGPRVARLVARWADEFNTRRRYAGRRYARALRPRARSRRSPPGPRPVERDDLAHDVGVSSGPTRTSSARACETRPAATTRSPTRSTPYLEDLVEGLHRRNTDRAAERISEYAAPRGVQRIVLNHELFDDLDMLELLAAEVTAQGRGLTLLPFRSRFARSSGIASGGAVPSSAHGRVQRRPVRRALRAPRASACPRRRCARCSRSPRGPT